LEKGRKIRLDFIVIAHYATSPEVTWLTVLLTRVVSCTLQKVEKSLKVLLTAGYTQRSQ